MPKLNSSVTMTTDGVATAFDFQSVRTSLTNLGPVLVRYVMNSTSVATCADTLLFPGESVTYQTASRGVGLASTSTSTAEGAKSTVLLSAFS